MFDPVTGNLVGAGIGAAGGVINNVIAGNNSLDAAGYNRDTGIMQSSLSAAEAEEARNWSAGQSAIARDYNTAGTFQAQAYNANQQEIARQFNSAEAATGRAWTEGMSNTAYQRTMADMKAAHLNPILAYRQGATGNPGATVASGGAASSSAPSTSAPGAAVGQAGGFGSRTPAQTFDIFAPALNNAMSLQRLANETSLTAASVAEKGALTETEKNKPDLVRSETALKGQHFERGAAEMPASRAVGEKGKVDTGVFGESAYEIARRAEIYGNAASSVIAPVTQAFRSFVPQRNSARSETTWSDTHGHGGSSFNERHGTFWR